MHHSTYNVIFVISHEQPIILTCLRMFCDSCTICRYPLIQALQHLIELIRALTSWDGELDQLVSNSRHRHDTYGPAEFSTWQFMFSNLCRFFFFLFFIHSSHYKCASSCIVMKLTNYLGILVFLNIADADVPMTAAQLCVRLSFSRYICARGRELYQEKQPVFPLWFDMFT